MIIYSVFNHACRLFQFCKVIAPGRRRVDLVIAVVSRERETGSDGGRPTVPIAVTTSLLGIAKYKVKAKDLPSSHPSPRGIAEESGARQLRKQK